MSFSPPTANLVLWLEANVDLYKDTAGTTPATADGDLVALWKDQSGNSNDVKQATSGNRPVLKTAIVNSLPVVRFTRTSSQQMATAGTVAHGIGTGDFWFACVFADLLGGGFNTVFSNGSFAPAFYIPHTTHPDLYLAGSHDFAASITVDNLYYLIEIARVSGVVKMWISSGGATPALDANTFSVATSIANAVLTVGNDNSGDVLGGNIAEIFFYKASLNSTDQTSLEQYLRNKYWGVNSGPPPSDNIFGGFASMTGGFINA